MSNTSSKSTSSETSDYQRRRSRSQPLDDMHNLHLPASESAIGEEMTSSTVGEMGTTKETASDSDQTPVFRIGDDIVINIQSSEVNRQDKDDHNLAVDTPLSNWCFHQVRNLEQNLCIRETQLKV